MSTHPLGDAPDRSYSSKLHAFARFAEPDLRRVIADLRLPADATVLDAGAGEGLISSWIAESLGDAGTVIAVDLSLPHLQAMPSRVPSVTSASSMSTAASGPQPRVLRVQADLNAMPLRAGALDLIWCFNAINHVTDPVTAVRRLAGALRPGGRCVLAQSGFLPEMHFAWDSGFDERVRAACHAYYRRKYGLADAATAGVRRLIGVLLDAGFAIADVTTKTYAIERMQPLSDADRRYFLDVMFRGYWGPKLQPFLSDDDMRTLSEWCDPASPGFCLDRRDFHHLQTLTVVQGVVSS
jgi:SAM-dependent methyltransferase